MVMEEQESDMELASEGIPVPLVQQSEFSVIKRSNKTGASRGKPRLRKKALYALILKQMEFYFGDANLSKDRYLADLLQKNTYVDLNIFTKFNKLRELTTDTDRIAKALHGSTMLKVSEDGTKVCRLTPINKKENVDECTIYVQNLPPDANHDWLISVFSKYGPVAYVSIPRYKSNRKIKGFAFVEFDTPKDAEECIKTFQKKGCVLPSHTAPDDLLSITTFDDNKKDITGREKTECPQLIPKEFVTIDAEIERSQGKESEKLLENENRDGDNNDENETNGTRNNIKQILGKRKFRPENITKESNVETKKRRTDRNTADQQSYANTNIHNRKILNEDITSDDKTIEIDRKKKERMQSFVKDTSQEAEGRDSHELTMKLNKNEKTRSEYIKESENDNECDVISQNDKCPVVEDDVTSSVDERRTGVEKKKRKRNRKRRSKIEDSACNAIKLQVMAKQDWKRLRNKYLDLQRSKMKQLKQHLRKTKWNYDKVGHAQDKSKHEKDKIRESEKSPYGRISYAPGIIVKIEMDEPCTDPQSFKMEIRDNNSVKYIDVTHDSCEAYVRCDTAEAAQSFAQRSNEGRRLTILKDAEEKSYWDKIERDREEKLNKKERFKHRGRDKLLKRAEKQLGKCIKFDEV